MRTQKIYFADQQSLCVFPVERSELTQVISELQLEESYPVIVLIGGAIEKKEEAATRQALQTISKLAEDMNALVLCGGTNMGVMADIGLLRKQNHYKFPLIGVAPEELVTWPDGPRNTKFLWWGKERWALAPYYSHFILVPGTQFGDESPWIFDTATLLSKKHRAVTILINGGEISRKDVGLSLENGRPVLALSRTGRLADEFSRQPNRDKLISVVPANNEPRIVEVVHALLAVNIINFPSQSLIGV